MNSCDNCVGASSSVYSTGAVHRLVHYIVARCGFKNAHKGTLAASVVRDFLFVRCTIELSCVCVCACVCLLNEMVQIAGKTITIGSGYPVYQWHLAISLHWDNAFVHRLMSLFHSLPPPSSPSPLLSPPSLTHSCQVDHPPS